ncbi:DUF3857 domain-containing protein [Aquimarina sp. MMG016]|uniref:DUF3857 domain-containing protein n=1 Tax=Aquimarina sp. MMG016 TaxID=2822690 RepID=UPI001B39FC5B|nr:DUF3857 domain-containing protein [Aquimarina sp. MMG016]MBQ4818456.1 DUF3857 domain-containing protein [Aquimarina sp. MMG016]
MKILNKVILVITLILTTNTFAQDYKFGKVSKEELLEKSYPLDSAANAVVLYENKKVHFAYINNQFQLVTDVFKRIKLYNKNGFDEASEQIYLYQGSNDREKVSGLKAMTYSLAGDEIIETKLKKDGIFESEYSEYYNEVKFTMPALQEGSVIEYKYKITSPYIRNIDKIYLQQDIPIKKIDIEVETPEYYNFKKYTRGYLPISLKESTKNNKLKGRRVEGSVYVIDYISNMYSINSSDIPAFKEEPYCGNLENYLSSIVFELQFTRFPNSGTKSYSSTWEDVAKSIYDNPRFGDELKKKNYFKEDIDQLITGINDPLKKTTLIFDFVKKKMTWNDKYRVVTSDGVKKAYKDAVGNSAEINLMLVAMLKYAKVNANPVLVSSNKRTISLFPTLEGFDYVIARVKSGNTTMYLDATDKYGEPNVLPDRVIHGSGRVLAENGTSQLVNFRPGKASRVQRSIMCQIDSGGVIKGKQSTSRSSYLAHSFRVRHGEKDKETQIKRIKERYELDDLNAYELKGVNELGKSVAERFEFTLENEAEVVDNEIFFSPLLFLRDKENIFKSEERKYPIDFGYGYANTMMVSIKIPEGYEVVEIPEGSAFKLPENMGKFVYRTNVIMGNTIQVSVTETLNAPFIPAEYYLTIKEFYNQIIQKESDQVVLKKV